MIPSYTEHMCEQHQVKKYSHKAFTMIYRHFVNTKCTLFCIFPNTFIFTLIVFNFAVGYDISQCLVLFSNLHSHSTQNIIKINPKSKELC